MEVEIELKRIDEDLEDDMSGKSSCRYLQPVFPAADR